MKDLLFIGVLVICFYLTYLFAYWCDKEISNKEEG